MADGKEWDAGRRPALIIGLLNNGPIDAERVGRMLIDLKADYQRGNGHSLVLSHMETGSMWFTLWDAVTWGTAGVVATAAVVEAGERLLEFGKRIMSAIQHADESSKEIAPPVVDNDSDDYGDEMQSAIRIVSIAAENKAGAEIIFENDPKGGRRIQLIRLLPAEAVRINAYNKRASSVRRRRRLKVKQGPAAKLPQTDDAQQDAVIEDFSKRLVSMSGTASDDDIRAFIAIIADTVKSTGSTHLLEQMASAMEAHGRWGIALMIREHIPPNDHLPPIRVS